MSSTPFPIRRDRSAIARNCSLVANPLGMRMRIMNFPGVGLRKKTPTHFSRSLSAGERFSYPLPISSGRSSRTRSGFHHFDAFSASTELRRGRTPHLLLVQAQDLLHAGHTSHSVTNDNKVFHI